MYRFAEQMKREEKKRDKELPAWSDENDKGESYKLQRAAHARNKDASDHPRWPYV